MVYLLTIYDFFVMVFRKIDTRKFCTANAEYWFRQLRSGNRLDKAFSTRILGMGGWSRRIPEGPTSQFLLNRLRQICCCFGSQPFPHFSFWLWVAVT
jgi:hypothetical protein